MVTHVLEIPEVLCMCGPYGLASLATLQSELQAAKHHLEGINES